VVTQHRRGSWVRLIALFLIVLGVRFWIISAYGSPLAILDQWDSEGATLFRPWLNGTLSAADLFRPHNEHRIAPSRVLALALLVVNRQWDSQLEMAVNALIFGTGTTLLAGAWMRLWGRSGQSLIPLAVGFWAALPYGQENILWGMQSAFYLMLFFSLLAIWGLGLHRVNSGWWWLGLASLALASLSLGSGFLAALAVLGLLVMRALSRKTIDRGSAGLAIICVLVVGLSLYFRNAVPYHESIKASDFRGWLHVFARCLAWPLSDAPFLSLLIYAPTMGLVAQQIRIRQTSPPTAQAAAAEFLIGIAGWVVLQAAAIAYTRGGSAVDMPVSRYMDMLGIGVVANLFAALLLVQQLRTQGRRRVGMGVLAVACLALLVATAGVSWQQLGTRMPRAGLLFPIEETVRAYVATGDRRYLEGEPQPPIPYPDAQHLGSLLDDPTIRAILPAIVRTPVAVRVSAATAEAFVRGGLPPDLPVPPAEVTWGSFSALGNAAKGSLQTEPLTTDFPYLRVEMAAGFEKGLSLHVLDEQRGRRNRIRPAKPDGRWSADVVKVPGPTPMLTAEDKTSNGWIAFREPRELGRLSAWSERLLKVGPMITVAGLTLGCVIALAHLLAAAGKALRRRLAAR